MNTTKAFRLSSILTEAKKYHRDCKSKQILKYYETRILALHLDGDYFLDAMKTLVETLGV